MSKDLPPIGKMIHELGKKFRWKICLHPEASKDNCGNQIIRAHTLSRNSTLDKIVDEENKLLTFHPVNHTKEVPPIHEKGWKEATTYYCFCDYHDNVTFSEIEDHEFVPTDEQAFLIGYRALAQELYMKKSAVSASDQLDEISEIKNDPIETYFNNFHNKEFERGLKNIEETKEIYDEALLKKSFEGFNYLVVSFSGSLSVASTGMMNPLHSLRDGIVQDYYSDFLENLFVGVTSNGGRHFIVFHWSRTYEKTTKYIEEMLLIRNSHLPTFLIQFMFLFIENTYFSKKWWEKLPSEYKKYLTALAYTPNPHRSPFRYENIDLVNWSNIKLIENF